MNETFFAALILCTLSFLTWSSCQILTNKNQTFNIYNNNNNTTNTTITSINNQKHHIYHHKRRSNKTKKNHHADDNNNNNNNNNENNNLASSSLEQIKKNNFRVTALVSKTVTLTCSIELDEVEFTKVANYRVNLLTNKFNFTE